MKTENHCILLRVRFSMRTVHNAVQGIFNWYVTYRQHTAFGFMSSSNAEQYNRNHKMTFCIC